MNGVNAARRKEYACGTVVRPRTSTVVYSSARARRVPCAKMGAGGGSGLGALGWFVCVVDVHGAASFQLGFGELGIEATSDEFATSGWTDLGLLCCCGIRAWNEKLFAEKVFASEEGVQGGFDVRLAL